MGMASSVEAARSETPATPILGMVSPPADYAGHLDGAPVSAEDVDLVARVLFMQISHKTYAGTSTACTGVAARIPGAWCTEATRGTRHGTAEMRIGHPAGVIDTEAEVVLSGSRDGTTASGVPPSAGRRAGYWTGRCMWTWMRRRDTATDASGGVTLRRMQAAACHFAKFMRSGNLPLDRRSRCPKSYCCP